MSEIILGLLKAADELSQTNPVLAGIVIVLVFLFSIGYLARSLGFDVDKLQSQPVTPIQTELKSLRVTMEKMHRQQLKQNEDWAHKVIEYQKITTILLHEMIMSGPRNDDAFARRQQLVGIIQRLQSGQPAMIPAKVTLIDTQELKKIVSNRELLITTPETEPPAAPNEPSDEGLEQVKQVIQAEPPAAEQSAAAQSTESDKPEEKKDHDSNR